MTRPHSPATAMTNSRSRFVVTYSVRPSGETTAPSGSPSIDIAPTRNCRTRSTTATSLVTWFVTQARAPDRARRGRAACWQRRRGALRHRGGEDRRGRGSGKQVRPESRVGLPVEGGGKAGKGPRHSTPPHARPRLASEAAHETITGGRFEP